MVIIIQKDEVGSEIKMAFYSYIFSANYARYFKNLKRIADKEHKNFAKLVLDTGNCVFRYGFCLSDYLNYKLYDKNRKERKEYVSTKTENNFMRKFLRVPINKDIL